MARLARIEYPGAIYHVINRGNYRRDVFGSPGAAAAFVVVLEEAVKRFEWELGAYVVMRNHFHLAIRTPHPNLSAGMQWLQVTFAARFNRLRGEQGHLFQGRFKSFVLQDEEVWSRVADYIHLNPLRAHIVEPQQLASFRWSSLLRFVQQKPFPGLVANPWLRTLGLRETPEGWKEYLQHLDQVHARELETPPDRRESYSSGWAIGADEWKEALRELAAKETPAGDAAEYQDPKEFQQRRWEKRLKALLEENEISLEDAGKGMRSASWKVRLADQLRREMGVPVVWLAQALNCGRPGALRARLCHYRKSNKLTT